MYPFGGVLLFLSRKRCHVGNKEVKKKWTTNTVASSVRTARIESLSLSCQCGARMERRSSTSSTTNWPSASSWSTRIRLPCGLMREQQASLCCVGTATSSMDRSCYRRRDYRVGGWEPRAGVAEAARFVRRFGSSCCSAWAGVGQRLEWADGRDSEGSEQYWMTKSLCWIRCGVLDNPLRRLCRSSLRSW